jgi:hypothetical protein
LAVLEEILYLVLSQHLVAVVEAEVMLQMLME